MEETIEQTTGEKVQGAKHVFNALAGLSERDQEALRRIKQTNFRETEKQRLNQYLRSKRVPDPIETPTQAAREETLRRYHEPKMYDSKQDMPNPFKK